MDADLRVADDFCSCVREEVSYAAAPDVPGSGQWQSNGLQRGGVGCLCDGEGRFAILYTIRNLPSINWRKPVRYHHTYIPEVQMMTLRQSTSPGIFALERYAVLNRTSGSSGICACIWTYRP
jgi:hypothetical protein